MNKSISRTIGNADLHFAISVQNRDDCYVVKQRTEAKQLHPRSHGLDKVLLLKQVQCQFSFRVSVDFELIIN